MYPEYTQISYASGSSVLNNRTRYPSFFRTVPSDELLAPALATLMNFYGWKQVAIVTEQADQFLLVRESSAKSIAQSMIYSCIPFVILHL